MALVRMRLWYSINKSPCCSISRLFEINPGVRVTINNPIPCPKHHGEQKDIDPVCESLHGFE